MRHLMMTEQALYILVFNAKKFEGKDWEEVDKVRVHVDAGGRTYGHFRTMTSTIWVEGTNYLHCTKITRSV